MAGLSVSCPVGRIDADNIQYEFKGFRGPRKPDIQKYGVRYSDFFVIFGGRDYFSRQYQFRTEPPVSAVCQKIEGKSDYRENRKVFSGIAAYPTSVHRAYGFLYYS